MYHNKMRAKTIALLGVILLWGVCGCDTEVPVQEEQNRGSVAGTVAETAGQEGTEITEAVTQEPAEITQAVTEAEEGIAGEAKPTNAVEAQPEDIGKETPTDVGETEPVDTEDSEKTKVADVLKEMKPEEMVLHVLTNAEGVYFTDGGVASTELKGYAEEKDVAYFVMKKQNGFGHTKEEVYIGVLNPDTGELLLHHCYGNTTSDAVMIENETDLYILYATECTDFGFYSGRGGVLLAKDGTLTTVWPLTPEGAYDDDYWNQHTARLNGEKLEIYKVIVTEVRPDGIASEMVTELERTVTLDEILAGAV